MLEGGGGVHVSALHRLPIRGRTMLLLTLISIKPFLWNSVPHRSRLPTCLCSISRWCRILAERAASETTRSGLFSVCVCVCVTLLDVRPLKSLLVEIHGEELFIIQPTLFGCFSSIGSKMFFQCYVIVCRPVKGEPPCE